jgi:hypothetical protein
LKTIKNPENNEELNSLLGNGEEQRARKSNKTRLNFQQSPGYI